MTARRSTCRFGLLLLWQVPVVCAIGGHARSASGQDIPDDQPRTEQGRADSLPEGDLATRMARETFKRGAALAKAGRWNDAIGAFEESYRIRRHPVTSYNIGYCERAVGHATRARKMLRRALVEHAAREYGELSPRLVELAEVYATEAEHQIARVRVVVDDRNARILVDGRPLERTEPIGTGSSPQARWLAGTLEPGPGKTVPALEFEVWVNPGVHLFVLERTGVANTVVTRRLERGATESVTFEPAPSVLPNGADPSSDAGGRSGVDRQWGFVALGIGAAGLVAGSIAGYQALRKRGLLTEKCGVDEKQCPEYRQGDIDSMEAAADVANVGFAVAALGIGAGALLLTVFKERSNTANTATPSLAPFVSVAGAGVRGDF